MSFERCPDPVWLSGGTLNHLADEPTDMPEADAPDDLPDRIVSVLEAADVDGPVSAGRLQRLLARDGIDVACDPRDLFRPRGGGPPRRGARPAVYPRRGLTPTAFRAYLFLRPEV